MSDEESNRLPSTVCLMISWGRKCLFNSPMLYLPNTLLCNQYCGNILFFLNIHIHTVYTHTHTYLYMYKSLQCTNITSASRCVGEAQYMEGNGNISFRAMSKTGSMWRSCDYFRICVWSSLFFRGWNKKLFANRHRRKAKFVWVEVVCSLNLDFFFLGVNDYTRFSTDKSQIS